MRLLLLGEGAVLAHRFDRPLAAELDDDQQSDAGARRHRDERLRSWHGIALAIACASRQQSAKGVESGADHPGRFESHGHLAVGVHGEVRMEVEERPGPIRPACDDVIEIRVLFYEQVAALDGPDALRIAKPKVRSVGRTGPIEGNRYGLAVIVLVEVNRPGIREVREVHQRVTADVCA